MRWEYCKLVQSTHNGQPLNWLEVLGQAPRNELRPEWDDIAQTIASLGEAEWELISIISRSEVLNTLDPAGEIMIHETTYYFKRPLPLAT